MRLLGQRWLPGSTGSLKHEMTLTPVVEVSTGSVQSADSRRFGTLLFSGL